MTYKNVRFVPERKRIITSYSEKRTIFISTLKKIMHQNSPTHSKIAYEIYLYGANSVSR
jgi:hypothetical protein